MRAACGFSITSVTERSRHVAFVGAQGLEGLFPGEHCDLLVIVPRASGFRRVLDLEQVHVANECPILAILPFLVMKSLTGVAFICLTTVGPSVEPVALIAAR